MSALPSVSPIVLKPVLGAILLALASSTLAASFDVANGTTSTTRQELLAGETGSVSSGGTLAVGGSNVAVTVKGSATLVNNGLIVQSGSERTIRDNTGGLSLQITNHAGAEIRSADADTIQMNKANSHVVLDNYGSIRSLNPSAGGSQAIDWAALGAAGSNLLNNHASGLIEAHAADALRPGVNGVVNNAGTIRALPVIEGNAGQRKPSGSDGIDAQDNTGIVVNNSGVIEGRHGITGGSEGKALAITVSNALGGSITGVNGSGVNIDGSGSFATVLNYGSIIGRHDASRFDEGDGDGVDVDGIVHLTNGGSILGQGAAGGGNNSEGVSVGGGTIVNLAGGTIVGDSARGNGVLVDNSDGGAAFAAARLDNSGLVEGRGGFAFKAIGEFADTVNNQSGAVMRGTGTEAAVQTGGGDDTVINRGLIEGSGGKAIDLGNGDDTLRIEGGQAAILGAVSGGAGNNAVIFELGKGARFTFSHGFDSFAHASLVSGQLELNGENAIDRLVATAGSVLSGQGSVGGKVEIEAGATLAPGVGIGSFSVDQLAFSATSKLMIELDPQDFFGKGTSDRLIVRNALQLDGTDLLIALLSAPEIGQSFDFIEYGTLDGSFTQGDIVRARYRDITYLFGVDYGVDGGTIKLATIGIVSEPGMGGLIGLGLIGLVAGRHRRTRTLQADKRQALR